MDGGSIPPGSTIWVSPIRSEEIRGLPLNPHNAGFFARTSLSNHPTTRWHSSMQRGNTETGQPAFAQVSLAFGDNDGITFHQLVVGRRIDLQLSVVAL